MANELEKKKPSFFTRLFYWEKINAEHQAELEAAQTALKECNTKLEDALKENEQLRETIAKANKKYHDLENTIITPAEQKALEGKEPLENGAISFKALMLRMHDEFVAEITDIKNDVTKTKNDTNIDIREATSSYQARLLGTALAYSMHDKTHSDSEVAAIQKEIIENAHENAKSFNGGGIFVKTFFDTAFQIDRKSGDGEFYFDRWMRYMDPNNRDCFNGGAHNMLADTLNCHLQLRPIGGLDVYDINSVLKGYLEMGQDKSREAQNDGLDI